MDEVEVDEKKLQAEFKEKIRFGHGRGSGSNTNWDLSAGDKKIIDREHYHF
jgi:hypothetical protein